MPLRRAQGQARTASRVIVPAVGLLFLLVAGLAWLLATSPRQARDDVGRTYQIVIAAERLLWALQDAETGERGFLLTGDPAYLEPYQSASGRVQPLLEELAKSLSALPQQQMRVDSLRPLVGERLDLLAETIALVQAGDRDAALALVASGQGKYFMDRIRPILNEVNDAERQLLDTRIAVADRAEQLTVIGTLLIVALLGGLLVVAGLLLRRAFRSVAEAEQQVEAKAQQLRTSLDSLSQGVSVFDAEATLITWNECFVKLFAVPQRLLRVGTPYQAFVRHDWLDEEGDFLETPEQLAATPPQLDGPLEPIVYERKRKDGRCFELRRTPLPVGGFVITYTDITHRLLTEQQLRQAQRLQAIGQLTGGVAHDFNNYLMVIIGNLELLRQRIDDPELVQRLEMALSGAERGAATTRQLLAYARRQPLEPHPVDVNRLITGVSGFLQRSMGESIEVRAVSAAGLWSVLADPAQLENALVNLALNARDAMPDGGRLTIEVANVFLDDAYARAQADVRPGAYVMLALTDTGIGMAPEVVARAFDPFFTTKSEGKGSGLGLSQVYGFIKQSGGHVKIYSEVGQGTAIKLYLPRSLQTSAQETREPENVGSGHEIVLVVEDDADVRQTAVATLRELGYAPLVAANGAEALAILSGSGPIDVLFTDVILPGDLHGRELAQQALTLRPGLRVLFTSGYTQNAIVHGLRVDEDVVFLSKPYKKDDLARKLRAVLDAPHAAARPAAAAEPHHMPDNAASEVAGTMPVSILIVEDDVMVRWLALDLVKELGHGAVEAGNGAEALALLDGVEPHVDAMIVDIGLPDLRGDALALQARRQRPDLPIVIASGYGEDQALEKLQGLDRVAFLGKPYTAAAVEAALSQVGILSRTTPSA